MVVKILTLQGEKNKRIAKKIKRLREDWNKAVRGHLNSRMVKARYDCYKEGLIEIYGLKKVSELMRLSNFYFS